MGAGITKTLKDKDMDRIFTEVSHNENLKLFGPGELRLFHLLIRDKQFYRDDLETWLYRNISRYVFSRARLEQFRQDDDLDAAIERALQTMRENGNPDEKGFGNELGEMLVYAFLEGKLKAPKLMSRVELSTDLSQYRSVAESIHLLSNMDAEGTPYNQMVFGTSNIVGDLQDAINNAFDAILRIKNHSSREIQMVERTALDRHFSEADIEFLQKVLVPSPNTESVCDTAYGVFLGYTVGVEWERHKGENYVDVITQKMRDDIRRYTPYINQKIKDNGLDMHSFYIYIVPFDDAETNKHEIMDKVMKGAVVL